MSINTKKTNTPVLLPWIPPGKPKEESSNRYVHKKNNKLDPSSWLNESSNSVWTTHQSKKSPHSPRKVNGSTRKLSDDALLLGSNEDRELLRDKILKIFKEDEEIKKKIDGIHGEELNKGGSHTDKSPSPDQMKSEEIQDEEKEKKKREERHSHNEQDSGIKSESKVNIKASILKSRRNSDSYPNEDEMPSIRSERINRSQAEHHRLSPIYYSDTDADRIGRNNRRYHSKRFDNRNNRNIRPIDIDDEEVYLESQRRHNLRFSPDSALMESRASRDSIRFIDSNNTNGYFVNRLDKAIPDPTQSYFQNNHYNQQEIVMTPLAHLNGYKRSRVSKPNAWMIIPEKDGRSSRAIPVSVSDSIGSRLKQSFTNISTLLNNMEKKEVGRLSGSNSDTPIEYLNDNVAIINKNINPRDEARERIFRCGVIVLILCFILAFGAIIAVIVLADQESTTSAKIRAQPTNIEFVSEGDECNKYTVLSESWRKIVGTGPRSTTGIYNCDLRRPDRPGSYIVPNQWYRFKGDAGSYIPTSPPPSDGEICGTSISAWINGEHPLVKDGVVTREFCFQWSKGPCSYKIDSQIRTCDDSNTGGTFYVYNLKFPSEIRCNFAFCATN